MGGKTLKFPKRKKFFSKGGDINVDKSVEPISEEERKKRLEHLKSLGLIKK